MAALNFRTRIKGHEGHVHTAFFEEGHGLDLRPTARRGPRELEPLRVFLAPFNQIGQSLEPRVAGDGDGGGVPLNPAQWSKSLKIWARVLGLTASMRWDVVTARTL